MKKLMTANRYHHFIFYRYTHTYTHIASICFHSLHTQAQIYEYFPRGEYLRLRLCYCIASLNCQSRTCCCCELALVKPITSFYFQTCYKRHYSIVQQFKVYYAQLLRLRFFVYYSLTELDSGFWICDVPDILKALLYIRTQCFNCHIIEDRKT